MENKGKEFRLIRGRVRARDTEGYKEIVIKVIPHEKQKYPTVGNYWKEKRRIQFRISNMWDWKFHMLVFIHEFVEWVLVEEHGINIKDIDKFDIRFEKRRELGLEKEEAEPGDDKKSPYYKEHQIATKFEKLLAKKLGVSWEQYNKAVMEA